MTKTDQEEFEAAMAEGEVEVLGGVPSADPDPALELAPVEPAPSAPPVKRRGRTAAKADMPALVVAATKMMERINVRRSFGGIGVPTFNDRCVLCEDTGVHSAQVMRCNCPCHDLRAALDGMTE